MYALVNYMNRIELIIKIKFASHANKGKVTSNS